jgi:predicted aconitase with swiveling domain
LPAIWLLSSNRNGISSCELARALLVTQKTAWFMLHRIREAMQTPTYEKLKGEVEADETFIGGKAHNQRKNRTNTGAQRSKRKAKGPTDGKTVVMGMIERGGNVRAFVVPDNRRVTVMPRIVAHIAPGSTVYTDALKSYC